MKDYNRMERVNELLHRELSLLAERYVAPGFDVLITVTGVKTSPDLRQAQVFVSVLGDQKARDRVLDAFRNQRALLQDKLNDAVKLKYTPVLNFKYDETAAQADRILGILDELDLDEDNDQPANEA